MGDAAGTDDALDQFDACVADVHARARDQLADLILRCRAETASQSGVRRPGAALAFRPAGLTCSFCATSQYEVRKLIAGPGVYICDACVELVQGVISSGGVTNTRLEPVHAVTDQDGRVRCRFCDKRRDQVTAMAAMSAEAGGEVSEPAAICNECLSLCIEIIAEELT